MAEYYTMNTRLREYSLRVSSLGDGRQIGLVFLGLEHISATNVRDDLQMDIARPFLRRCGV